MKDQAELLEQMRQQFDNAPYPRMPLDSTPKKETYLLYIHSLVTAYYLRNQKVISPEGKLILDAGCGTGYTSLMLALANPGAKIIGIDLSDESIKLAQKRLQYHQVENVEFYAMLLEDLPSLGITFDYIDCDEVLYLLPDPMAGLAALKAVLKPDGILRVNFHSSLQRFVYLRMQQFFKHIGLMDGPPEDEHVQLVRETMHCLKDSVFIKNTAWKAVFEQSDEAVLANYLLQGDKGWTIPEFFAALREVNLEFISMVNWQQWDLMDLFNDINEVPLTLALSMAEKSLEEQLHLYELLHPVHRLLDIWCGLPGGGQSFVSVSEWSIADWQQARIFLHPQLPLPELKADLIECINQFQMFDISRHLSPAGKTISIDSLMAGCLLPLFDGPQSPTALVDRLQQLRPFHPVTLEATTFEEAFELVRQLLITLEGSGHVLIERVSAEDHK